MVAYNFHPMFAPQISRWEKLQTVRANRKRHARPGEALQLFCGMRTRHCIKLLADDPICRGVQPIAIHVTDLIDDAIGSIVIAGRPLSRDEIERFAISDGFATEKVGFAAGLKLSASARANMGAFWKARHGLGLFEGQLIKWAPR